MTKELIDEYTDEELLKIAVTAINRMRDAIGIYPLSGSDKALIHSALIEIRNHVTTTNVGTKNAAASTLQQKLNDIPNEGDGY